MEVDDTRQLLLGSVLLCWLEVRALQSQASLVHQLKVRSLEPDALDCEVGRAKFLYAVLISGRADDGFPELTVASA